MAVTHTGGISDKEYKASRKRYSKFLARACITSAEIVRSWKETIRRIREVKGRNTMGRRDLYTEKPTRVC